MGKYDIVGTILIPGGRGYIGSNTINKIFGLYKKLKFIVIGLTNPNDKSTIKESIVSSPRYKYIKMNIGNNTGVMKILKKYNVTMVLHLASYLPTYELLKISRSDMIENNVINSDKFLSTCEKYGKIKHFMFQASELGINGSTTTQLESFNKLTNSYLINLYETTKMAQIHLATSYKVNKKMPITIISPTHIYGGDNPHQILSPNVYANNLLMGKKINLYKNDDKNYDSFLHIDDLIDAYVVIINNGFVNKNYNPLNAKLSYSNYEIVQMIKKSHDVKEDLINLNNSILTEMPNISIDKISSNFTKSEWSPKHNDFEKYVKSLKANNT